MRRCAGYDEVFQIGLGKSGTTTIQTFFTARYDYNATCGNALTVLIQNEINARQPLLDAARAVCPHFYVSELLRVYFPSETIALQLTDMHALRVAAPGALFVHCARNTDKWLSSVARWYTLQSRLAQRDLPGLPRGVGWTLEELRPWYDGVNDYLAFTFAHRRNYVRVNVDDPDSLSALESFCGGYNQSYTWVPQNVNKHVSPNLTRNTKTP